MQATLTTDEVRALAHRLYGIDVEARRLASCSDQSFLLEHASSRRLVLEVAGPAESLDHLDLVTRAMEHVAACDASLGVPRVCTTLDGERITTIRHGDATHRVRLLTYLEGASWVDSGPHTLDLHRQLGRFVGALDASLGDFSHPARHRHHDRDLRHALGWRSHAATLAGSERRLVERALARFASHVAPLWDGLRTGAIHGDASDSKVLVTADGNAIAGLIGFGDVVHTAMVCEIAIATAHAMLEAEEPLASGCQVVRGYHEAYPLERVELDVLFDLIVARLAVCLVRVELDLRQDPGSSCIEAIRRPIRRLLVDLIDRDPRQVREQIGDVCAASTFQVGRSVAQLLDSRRRHLGGSLSIAYRQPLKIVRGSGPYLIDDSGRAYLDSVNNVSHVGHCHPRVVAAAAAQARVLNTNTRYLHDGLVEYTRRLAASLPAPLEVCYLVNSGSEANDLALRLARAHTGHRDAVVVDGAYHGTTISVVELSSYKFNGPGGSGLAPHVHLVPTPDVYRGPHKAGDPAAGRKYAADVLQAIEAAHRQGRRIAAFFCESMLSCGGQVILPEDYLQEAFRHVRAAGGVCAMDEVQVGFGRAGVKFWAFETQNVVPDIVTMGKPIGNGHPMSAVVTTRPIAESFANGMEYFNTFGGNPVSCAVGLAVLDVIEEEGLQENARVVGAYLLEKLRALAGRHRLIGDVRGLGLFLGIELVRDRETLEPASEEATVVVEKMKDRAVLLSSEGPFHNVLKIKPPMVWTTRHADVFVEALDQVLAEMG